MINTFYNIIFNFNIILYYLLLHFNKYNFNNNFNNNF